MLLIHIHQVINEVRSHPSQAPYTPLFPMLESFEEVEWTSENDMSVRAPFEYLMCIPGKGIRLKHVESFNAILEVPQSKSRLISLVIQSLHTSSLLMDDIEDDAILRRGLPAAHTIYGVPSTANAASYSIFWTLSAVMSILGTDTVKIIIKEILSLHRGQGLDIMWRDTGTCPTEDEYLAMASNKTGGLLRMAVRMLQLHSQVENVDLVPLASVLGVLYQVRDDYLNLLSKDYEHAKGFAEDITEGKLSFPVIHCIRSSDTRERNELLSILRRHSTDENIKKYAISLLNKTGSLAYTKNAIDELARRSKALIGAIPSHFNKAPLLELVEEISKV